MEENGGSRFGDSFQLLKIIVYIGIGGNIIVGIVALYFMASGLTGTHFLTEIKGSAGVSTSFIILSILFFLIVSILSLISVIGLVKMLNREKKGRTLFLIANGVWITLTFMILQQYSFYQLGIFSAIFTLVLFFLSRDEMLEGDEESSEA